jgi:FkbM family methyltransferase
MKKGLLSIIHSVFKIRFMEAFLLGRLKNSNSKNFLLKLAPPNTAYDNFDIRHCTRYGINYKLHLNDYQSWVLYFYSDSDSSFGCLKYLKKGDVAIDVGGNIGQTALMIAKKVDTNGKVISFEPFASTYDRFRENLKLNPSITNVTLEKLALGEKAMEMEMYVENKKNSGGNRIKPQENETITRLQKVIGTTLDAYCTNAGLNKITLIKIDVEGFEMKVLNGAKDVIKKFKPDLYLEANDANLRSQGDSLEKMFDFLEENAYTIFDAETGALLKKWTECTSWDIYCKAN